MSASASRNTSTRSPDLGDPHALAERLAAFLRRTHGARAVRVEGLRRLTGGASRQTWSFDAVIERGAGAPGTVPLILRRDLAPGASYMTQAVECRLLAAVHLVVRKGKINVNRANARKMYAVCTSNAAMKAKINGGVSAATASCGKYWPKKVSNCSTPSTRDITTSPVRF